MEKNKEYYEGLDKRTNEYKNWKASQVDLVIPTQEELQAKHEEQSKGLGDTVEKVFKATGIKAAVEFFTPEGKDCGCDKRKSQLNELFKYRTPLCLEVEEYEVLDDILNRDLVKRRRGLKHSEQKELLKVYNRIFQVKKAGSSCNDCLNSLLTELTKVYETYK